jgi:hypothetical protein
MAKGHAPLLGFRTEWDFARMVSRLVDFGRLDRMRDRKLDSEEFAVKMIHRLSWGFATRRSRSYGGSWFSWGWSRNNSACFGDLGRGYSFTPIRSSG